MNVVSLALRKVGHAVVRLRQLVKDEDHDSYYEEHRDPSQEKKRMHGGGPTMGAT